MTRNKTVLDLEAFFLYYRASQRVCMPDDSRKEVSVSQPAVAESLRPIQVFSYPPTLAGSKRLLPDALTQMFLRELSTEPHQNNFYCNTCGRPYTIAAQEGKSCTRPQEGGVICHGKVIRRWTKDKAQVELQRLMTQGGVAIAWELAQPSVPIGLAVCEAHRSETVLGVIDFPMNALGAAYGKLGRQEPFLILTHLWIDRVEQSQEVELMRSLVEHAVEPILNVQGLDAANVLMPMSSRDTELRRVSLRTMLSGKQQMLLCDTRPDRHRVLWGFRIRIRND